MRDTKRRLELFSFHDRTGLARHLEAMAAKGWLLEKIGPAGWVYRRTEPRKLTFYISYYPRASAFDPAPSEDQNTFYDFCEHTGWVLAASYGQMQIFYNERENPVPIETDPVVEVETIRRAAGKNMLISHGVLLAVGLLNSWLYVARLLRDPPGVLSSPANLFTGLCWTQLLLICAVELGGYFRWLRRARRAAQQGEFLETRSHPLVQKLALGIVGAGLLYYGVTVLLTGNTMYRTIAVLMFLYVMVVVILVNGVKELLKHWKVRTGINRAVTFASSFILSFGIMGGIVFGVLAASSRGAFAGENDTYTYHGSTFVLYNDQLPLAVEDLTGMAYEGYVRQRNGEESLLLGQLEVWQTPRFDNPNYRELPTLRYTITEVKAPFLYDICKNSLLRQITDTDFPEGHRDYYEARDAAPWGAAEAYQEVSQAWGPRNRYLLCYEKRIVEIRFDWEPAPEQMAIVAEKLGK